MNLFNSFGNLNMKVSVLGTGMVGQCIATKLAHLDHEVMVGSRDRKNPKAQEWIKQESKLSLGTFEDSAAFGDLIFNCTLGSASLNALEMAGEKNIGSKILIDTANPLEFGSKNEATLFVCNTDSLGEQIQKRFPEAKVVKTFNTINAKLMVHPSLLKEKHNIFLAGNHENAKKTVRDFLTENFKWKEDSFIDLGDISGSRAAEMLAMVWIRLWQHYQNPVFNFSVASPSHPFRADF